MVHKNWVRQTISISVAMLIAVATEYYFSRSHDFLIPLTTFFVMLTSAGNLTIQGLKRFIAVIVLVTLLSLIFSSYDLLLPRLFDVSLGAGIGILSSLIILPRKADEDFRDAILPLLIIYKNYFTAIVALLLEQKQNEIESIKISLESHLQHLPVWVYERGFDVGLKKGHQYFLMKISYIAEILFSMHHVARFAFEKELLDNMRDPLLACSARVKDFLDALVTVFKLKKLSQGVDDFESELMALDKKFQDMLPVSLELLDMSQEDVNFYAFIYGLADLRKALIKLGQALR